MDYHPPSIYFPRVVHKALMTDPTETENQETLVAFAGTRLRIAEEPNGRMNSLRGVLTAGGPSVGLG